MNRPFFSMSIAMLGVAVLLSARAQSTPPAQALPKERSASSLDEVGTRTFSTNCSGCHGADGRGGERAPNIATARNIISLSDDDLVAIVNKGVPGSGMPSFASLGDRTIKDVIAYLRVLQGKTSDTKVNGDPSAGRALFFGRAECSQCHMVKGEGGFIGSDLTDYASGVTQDVILLAITKPDAVLAPSSTIVELLLPNGERIIGTARAEDNFNITVQMKDGRWRTFDKSKLADVKHTGHSLHPRDYGIRLSTKELDDLTSYLVSSAANVPSRQTRRRSH